MPIGAAAAIAAVGVGTSIASSKAQEKAAKRADKTQRNAQNRQIDLQEKMFNEGKPYRDIGLQQLQDLRAQYLNGDAYGPGQFNEEMRQTNNALAATGNLRSGFAQDLTQRASERAYDRNLVYRTGLGTNVASLASGQGQAYNQNALALQPGINGIYDNRSNLQLARGGIQSGLYNSVGNTLAGATMFGMSGSSGSLFGQSSGEQAPTGYGPALDEINTNVRG